MEVFSILQIFWKTPGVLIIVIFILISIITRDRPTLFFSVYVGSRPASTVYPKKKYQEFRAPQKMFEILGTPKNIPHSVPCP